MAPPTQAAVEALYNTTLATAKRFSSYNFQHYFVRRAQLDFDRGKATFDQNAFEKKVKELETLKRCAEVNRMYEGPKLVVEYARPITSGGGSGAEASP